LKIGHSKAGFLIWFGVENKSERRLARTLAPPVFPRIARRHFLR
jgi:hypothetical protein